MKSPDTLMRRMNAVMLIGAALWFFLIPGALRIWRSVAVSSIVANLRPQLAIWLFMLMGGVILLATRLHTVGLLMILGAQFLPRKVKP